MNRKIIRPLASSLSMALPATLFSAMFLTACGGGSGGSSFIIGDGGVSSGDTGKVSIGISDAPVDGAEEVVIEIDKITFRMAGEDDVVVDQFTSSDLGITDAETFTIDLLDYQGSEQAIVINNIELAKGAYTDMILDIIDEDVNSSYVLETESGLKKELKAPSDTLKLGGFTVAADGVQTFTIEFNLRQAMAYRPGPEIYNLKPRGVRIQDNATDSTLRGNVVSTLFDTETACSVKEDSTVGNIVYLYEGHDLLVEDLADVFDPILATGVPAKAIAPYAATAVVQNENNRWEYTFAFLPEGEYTLVFSCDAVNDDPESYDGITLALPDDQLIELTLNTASGTDCNLPIVSGACSN